MDASMFNDGTQRYKASAAWSSRSLYKEHPNDFQVPMRRRNCEILVTLAAHSWLGDFGFPAHCLI